MNLDSIMEDEIKANELVLQQRAQKAQEKKFDMKMTQIYPVIPLPVYTPPKLPIQSIERTKFFYKQTNILPNAFPTYKIQTPTFQSPVPLTKLKISQTKPKKIKQKIIIELPEEDLTVKTRVKPFIQNDNQERRGRPRKEDTKKKSSAAEKIFGCNVCSLFFFLKRKRCKICSIWKFKDSFEDAYWPEVILFFFLKKKDLIYVFIVKLHLHKVQIYKHIFEENIKKRKKDYFDWCMLKQIIGENIIDKDEKIVNINEKFEEIEMVGIYFSGKW
jgi:hypothetical protein